MKNFLEKLELLKIGQYSFLDEVKGGKASTALIYVDTNGQKVLVKMLIAPRNESELHAFENESKILKQLQKYKELSHHPKIIEDFQKVLGHPVYYFIMEFVEGTTLKDYISNIGEPLNWDQALGIIQRIAIALGAGSSTYIHRDLHPGNIMLTDTEKIFKKDYIYDDPEVRILDYGCSKDHLMFLYGTWYEDKFRHVGAISTWSPEFLLAPHKVDSAHDSWAIGVILFYLITFKYPFHSTCFGELIQLYQEKNQDYLNHLSDYVPYAVTCLIKNLLSFNPNERFRAGQIADMCSEILYNNLNDKDQQFIDMYMMYGGNICKCTQCHSYLGRIHTKCPSCGLSADDENTYPASVNVFGSVVSG